MNRRLILIFAGIIGFVILVLVLLLVAVKKNNQTNNPNSTSPFKLTKVIDQKVVSPISSYDNNSIWYFNDQGRLFSVKVADTSKVSEFTLPTLNFDSFRRGIWPNAGYDFISSSGSTEQRLTYYNSDKKVFVNLPTNIQSFDWMPDGKRIVYVWKSGDNKNQQLVIANADGTGFRKVADLFWPDLKVAASNDSNLALLWRGNTQEVNKIYQIDLKTGQISTLIDQGKNLEAVWVGDGKFIFTQASTQTYPKLVYYDLSTKKSTDLGINTTLDKIAIDTNQLYAAVPKKDKSGDTFVKINLSDLKQENYFSPESAITARNLFFVGHTLHFVNNADSKLYEISE